MNYKTFYEMVEDSKVSTLVIENTVFYNGDNRTYAIDFQGRDRKEATKTLEFDLMDFETNSIVNVPNERKKIIVKGLKLQKTKLQRTN